MQVLNTIDVMNNYRILEENMFDFHKILSVIYSYYNFDEEVIIGGSFISSLLYRNKKDLKYNDIDIFISDNQWRKFGFQNDFDVWKVNINGVNEEINFLRTNIYLPELGSIIFDINAISVAMKINFSIYSTDMIKCMLWYIDPSFNEFYNNSILKINEKNKLCQKTVTFIRLLYKANKLSLDFQTPTLQYLMSMRETNPFLGQASFCKYMSLNEPYKEVFHLKIRFFEQYSYAHYYNTRNKNTYFFLTDYEFKLSYQSVESIYYNVYRLSSRRFKK